MTSEGRQGHLFVQGLTAGGLSQGFAEFLVFGVGRHGEMFAEYLLLRDALSSLGERRDKGSGGAFHCVDRGKSVCEPTCGPRGRVMDGKTHFGMWTNWCWEDDLLDCAGTRDRSCTLFD